jgi:hypothetical protein
MSEVPKHEDVDLEGTMQRLTRFSSGHLVSTVDLKRGTARSDVVAMFDSISGASGGRYETMTFPPGSSEELKCDRADTWEEACEHHRQHVEELAATLAMGQELSK